MIPTFHESERIYRVDKFVVPSHALDEFIDKVQQTHSALKTVEGFIQDFILEQADGSGEFNIVTIVIWENATSIEKARQVVKAKHEAMNLDAREMYARLGIKANIATYKRREA